MYFAKMLPQKTALSQEVAVSYSNTIALVELQVNVTIQQLAFASKWIHTKQTY